MINFAALGNDLYTGKRSIDFVGRYKRWYVLSGIFVLLADARAWSSHGLNLSLEFRGGSEFRVSDGRRPATPTSRRAKDAVTSVAPRPRPRSPPSARARSACRPRSSSDDRDPRRAGRRSAKAFDTDGRQDVSASFVGPSWGASVSQKALQALAVFLALVALGHGDLLPHLEDGRRRPRRAAPRPVHHGRASTRWPGSRCRRRR